MGGTRMIPSPGTGGHVQRAPLLTGVSGAALTRAVLRYTTSEDRSLPGGRMADIGLGVVLESGGGGESEILDLGSGNVHSTALTGPLVILGWAYTSTVSRLRGVRSDDPEALRRLVFDMALRVLDESGFSSLTRPVLLRIGFRDLVRDMDLHEGTAVRLLLPGGRVARMHLDYESATLVVRTGATERHQVLEAALASAFDGVELLGGRSSDAAGLHAYHLPFPVPGSVDRTRRLLSRLRRGIFHLLARFEPDRYRAVREQVETFGARDSLARLESRRADSTLERLSRRRRKRARGDGSVRLDVTRGKVH